MAHLKQSKLGVFINPSPYLPQSSNNCYKLIVIDGLYCILCKIGKICFKSLQRLRLPMLYLLGVMAYLLAPFTLYASEIPQIDLRVISKIESRGDANAVSFKGASYGRGLFQVSDILLKDFNQKNIVLKNDGTRLGKKDLFDPFYSELIADWYFREGIPRILRAKKKPITLDTLLISYNCGHACVGNPLPKETKNYIRSYKKEVGTL